MSETTGKITEAKIAIEALTLACERYGVREKFLQSLADCLDALIDERDIFVAALEAAPKPTVGMRDAPLSQRERDIVEWYDGPRAAALAKARP